MRNVTVLLVLAAVALSTSVAVAEEHEGGMMDNMTTTVSLDYVSQYMFYGIDTYPDDDAAFQPSINLDMGNGLSLNVWGSWPIESGGDENARELDYTVAYAFSAMEDEAMQMDFTLNWTYFDLYDSPSDSVDSHEFGAMVAFPNLMDNGIVPHYRFVRLWATDSTSNPTINGYVHIFGMSYDFTTESFINAGQQQEWNLGVDVVYNDEYVVSESDWSHAVAKLAAPMEMGQGTLTPMVAYQMTMGDFDGNSDDDEFYYGVSYSMDF